MITFATKELLQLLFKVITNDLRSLFAIINMFVNCTLYIIGPLVLLLPITLRYCYKMLKDPIRNRCNQLLKSLHNTIPSITPIFFNSLLYFSFCL